MVRRYAFTMIELIFAIVIISIAVVSLPIMTQSVDRGLESNIIQEGIFASETAINEGMGSYWDANSQSDTALSGGLSRVIRTIDNNCTVGFPNKASGHINRRCLDNLATPVSNNAAVLYTLDNLNNAWNNKNIILNNSSTNIQTATYKADYNATATVVQCNAGCIQFGNVANNSSLKEITFTITNANGDTLIVLRAYSANIGDVEIAKKVL